MARFLLASGILRHERGSSFMRLQLGFRDVYLNEVFRLEDYIDMLFFRNSLGPRDC